jgi:hypothetical protein
MRLARTPGCGYRRWEMPQTYDTTFKELFAHNFVALLRWLIPDVKAYEVLKLPEELPLTTRRADLMVRIDEGAVGDEAAPLVSGSDFRLSGAERSALASVDADEGGAGA